MNPYDPQTPTRPEAFAGRQRLLDSVQDFLEKAEGLRRGTSMLLYGYRGSGKTSALRKIEAVARARFPEMVLAEVQLRAELSDDALLRALIDEVVESSRARPKTRSKVLSALGRVSGVNVLGAGISLSEKSSKLPSNPFTVWRSVLSSLSDVPLLLVGIDDAELLEPAGLGTLKAVAELDSPVPVLMVVTGGPEFLENLSKKEYSPIARIFSGAEFDIGSFTPEETAQALMAPLARVRSKTRWAPEALARVQVLTHGYPYLVQCVAQAAFQEGKVLHEAEVSAAVPRALAMGSNWLSREVPSASDEDIRAFLRIAGLNLKSFRSQDAVRAGVATQYVSRLANLGVLKRVARGHYELRKAPVVAYYHALRRGLTA